jgi:O-antigen/teichoic acid export membrane protein
VRIACLIGRTIAIVVVLNQSPKLLPLAVVLLIANLVEHALFAALCWYYLPHLRFRVALVDRATVRDVRGYSVNAFLAMLAGRITIQTGTIALGFFLSPVHAAIYLTALRLVEYAKTLLRTITSTLTPGVSAMQARGDDDGIADRHSLGAVPRRAHQRRSVALRPALSRTLDGAALRD